MYRVELRRDMAVFRYPPPTNLESNWPEVAFRFQSFLAKAFEKVLKSWQRQKPLLLSSFQFRRRAFDLEKGGTLCFEPRMMCSSLSVWTWGVDLQFRSRFALLPTSQFQAPDLDSGHTVSPMKHSALDFFFPTHSQCSESHPFSENWN